MAKRPRFVRLCTLNEHDGQHPDRLHLVGRSATITFVVERRTDAAGHITWALWCHEQLLDDEVRH